MSGSLLGASALNTMEPFNRNINSKFGYMLERPCYKKKYVTIFFLQAEVSKNNIHSICIH